MGGSADALERASWLSVDLDALALVSVPSMSAYANSIVFAFTLAVVAILNVIIGAENGFACAGATVSVIILIGRAFSIVCASEAADRIWLPGINGIISSRVGALASAVIGVVEGERRQAFVAFSFVLDDGEDQTRGISVWLIDGLNL